MNRSPARWSSVARHDGARLWRNPSGDRFSAPVQVDIPSFDSLSSVELAGILGKGAAALVWPTDLPHRHASHIVDLMSAGEPDLLRSAMSNIGAECAGKGRRSFRGRPDASP